MKIVLNNEMKALDKKTIENIGMPSLLLMENAGLAIVNEIINLFGEDYLQKKICIFAGHGNNGGDALVTARHLVNSSVKTKIFLLDGLEGLSEETAINFNILKKMQADITIIKDSKTWDEALVNIMFSDLLIDGLLGTGFNGKDLSEDLTKLVEMVNNSGKTVLSIDIPSGVNGDSGEVSSVAIKASQTVTLSSPKLGLFLAPGRNYVGKISIAPIGIPKSVYEETTIKQNLITLQLVQELLPVRSPYAHKNQAKAAIVAGSLGMSGAAALCSEATLRAGAGVVRLFTPQSVSDLLALKLTEVMVEGIPDETNTGLQKDSSKVLLERLSEYNVVAVGPGLGTQQGTDEIVGDIIEKIDKKLVLDADALNILVGKTELLPNTKQIAVITPHLGEMSRLTELSVEKIIEEGIVNVAKNFAAKWRSIIVLKGVPTVIALPSGEVFINTTGNQGMATAGSGDVLTGSITALMAQGLDQASAAICGVYLHGLAGDIIARESMIGIAAGDIVAVLPKAWGTVAEF